MSESVKVTPELQAVLDDMDRQIDEAQTRVHELQAQRQRLLDDQVASLAQFKKGDVALMNGKRYRVTKVSGEYQNWNNFGGGIAVALRYHGEKLKANGETYGRERWLFDLKPEEDK